MTAAGLWPGPIRCQPESVHSPSRACAAATVADPGQNDCGPVRRAHHHQIAKTP